MDPRKRKLQAAATRLNFLTILNREYSKLMEDQLMKKVNYAELSEMLKSGQSQADCARHFQVSEPAISKAVKRLKAAEIPASMERLSKKEKVFVLNLAEGKNATESAFVAYDCASRDVAKTMGCRMAKDPDIELALADIMAQEAIPRRRRVQRLRDLIESKDLSAVSRGLDMSWKLDGSYSEKNISPIIDIRALVLQCEVEEKNLTDRLNKENAQLIDIEK